MLRILATLVHESNPGRDHYERLYVDMCAVLGRSDPLLPAYHLYMSLPRFLAKVIDRTAWTDLTSRVFRAHLINDLGVTSKSERDPETLTLVTALQEIAYRIQIFKRHLTLWDLLEAILYLGGRAIPIYLQQSGIDPSDLA